MERQHISYVTMSPAYDLMTQVYQPTIDTCFILLHKQGYIQSNTIIPSHPIHSLLTKHFKYCVPRRKQMWSGWIEANIKTWLRWYKYINNQRTSDTLLSCGYGIWTVGNHSDQESWPLAVEDFDRYLLRFWILWWFENIDSIFSAKIYIYYK